MMTYFDDRKNAESYIKMVQKYDGSELVNILLKFLAPGSTVLELGMGPGKDFDLLSKNYTVTGSDASQAFLDIYREKNPTADLLQLDAVSLKTEKKFDCIYSNKVLQHLPKSDILASFSRQRDLLNSQGLLFHSFWRGDKIKNHKGLLFVYYQEESLLDLIGPCWIVLETNRYKESRKNDSFYMVLQKDDL